MLCFALLCFATELSETMTPGGEGELGLGAREYRVREGLVRYNSVTQQLHKLPASLQLLSHHLQHFSPSSTPTRR